MVDCPLRTKTQCRASKNTKGSTLTPKFVKVKYIPAQTRGLLVFGQIPYMLIRNGVEFSNPVCICKRERVREKERRTPRGQIVLTSRRQMVYFFPLCLFFFYTSAPEIAPILCQEDIFRIEAPQFLIGAAAKTGSTSLYSYLCQHPSIERLAKKKETNLLRTPRKIKIPNEKEKFKLWYQQEGFKERESCDQSASYITFEASVHYYHHKTALENLQSLLPCSKIVWVLWNPLSRAVSEYLHQAVKSRSYPTFSGLLKSELNAINTCGNSQMVLS